MFQSPSLRGSGRFLARNRDSEARLLVSIPFIAGQWSLRAKRLENQLESLARFNPLHCGAVVASRRTRGGLGAG